MTLVGVPGMTLAEVPLLLTDAAFRRRLVGRIDDPIAIGPFWAAYEAMSDAERAQVIGPVMNKLRAFLLHRLQMRLGLLRRGEPMLQPGDAGGGDQIPLASGPPPGAAPSTAMCPSRSSRDRRRAMPTSRRA